VMSEEVRTSEWVTTTVGEVATLVRGITYNKEQASKSSSQDLRPILRANNINGTLNFDDLVFVPQHLIRSEQIIKAGDIIFAMSSGSKHLVGKSARARIDFDGSYGAFCGLLRAHEHVDKDFLYYVFQNNRFRRLISEVAKGSNINNLKREHILDFEIALPPLPEQHRIVAKIEELFSELDKGIENLKTAQAQLKVYRQALLKHAFEGKLTAQWRAENSVIPAQVGIHSNEKLDSRLRGNDSMGGGNDRRVETAEILLKRIQQERAQRFQQQLADWEAADKQGSKPKAPKILAPLTAEDLAELPELPEGWGWVKLGDLASKITDGEHFKPPITVEGVCFLSAKDVKHDGVSFDDPLFIDVKTAEKARSRCNPERNDILIVSRGATVGRMCLVKTDQLFCLLGSVILIKSTEAMQSNYFLSALKSPLVNKKIVGVSGATAQQAIYLRDIQNVPVPVCSSLEQSKIVEELESKLSEVDQLDQTITTSLQQAEALRQSILKKAFSGQLVEQDPHDEPAPVLLARIKAERATVAKTSTVAAKPRKGSTGNNFSPIEIASSSVSKEP